MDLQPDCKIFFFHNVKVVYNTFSEITIKATHGGSLMEELSLQMLKQDEFEMSMMIYVVQTTGA
jgi:hypothetical protein